MLPYAVSLAIDELADAPLSVTTKSFCGSGVTLPLTVTLKVSLVSLGMKVTAEGVETPAQLAWVRSGCDEAQGYLLSRPVPASDIARVMAELDTPRESERLAG